MTNLIVRIVLPKGLGLLNKQTLQKDLTLEIVGAISPWYCSVDQVRLEAGPVLRGLSDITIAASIYQAGRDCDAITVYGPPAAAAVPSTTGFETLANEMLFRYQLAQQRYTQFKAARKLVLNMWDINMSRGTKTLGNFSITRYAMTKDEEIPKKLTTFEKEIKDWEVVVRSGGKIAVGGRPSFGIAAKSILGEIDRPAGRTWMVTGMGANLKTEPGLGSWGKPKKFGTPNIVHWRQGRVMGGVLSVLPTFFTGGIY